MPIVLVEDFSGASLPGGLQADDDTLRGNTRDGTASGRAYRSRHRANSYRLQRPDFTAPGTLPLDPVPNTRWACSRAPDEEPPLKSSCIQTGPLLTPQRGLVTEANWLC